MFERYNDVMSVSDVAEALYVSKNRVYKLLASGELKGFRMGTIWKIPRLAVQEYVLRQSKLSIG